MKNITSKIETLKNELGNSYGGSDESLAGLELKLLKVDELIETGFIEKNIKGIFDHKSPGFREEIDEYFGSKCYGLMWDEIDRIFFPEEPISIGEYIFYLKLGTVRSSVRRELTSYLKTLKNEKPDSGNTENKTHDNNPGTGTEDEPGSDFGNKPDMPEDDDWPF
jgi:hypothetical protein